MIRSRRQAGQIPATGVRAAHHHQVHALAGAKAQTLRRPEDAVLILGFNQPHAIIVARAAACGPSVQTRQRDALTLPRLYAPSNTCEVTTSCLFKYLDWREFESRPGSGAIVFSFEPGLPDSARRLLSRVAHSPCIWRVCATTCGHPGAPHFLRFGRVLLGLRVEPWGSAWGRIFSTNSRFFSVNEGPYLTPVALGQTKRNPGARRRYTWKRSQP